MDGQCWMATMTNDERTFFQELGLRIAKLRKERGITQCHLAEILGVSQQTITSFEKGRRRVPVSLLPVLAKALALSVEELLGEHPQPRKRGPAPKLLQQMELINQLPKAKQRFVMQMLDAVLHQSAGN
jgi:transcriptional regulator with XRE-family HTH domain